jgi:uncharacterized protein (DUF433 family)
MPPYLRQEIRRDDARADRDHPDIMGGQPVIRGTRVPVEIVLRKLGAAEAIMADHPRLVSEDIRAAQAFAADYLADEALVYD